MSNFPVESFRDLHHRVPVPLWWAFFAKSLPSLLDPFCLTTDLPSDLPCVYHPEPDANFSFSIIFSFVVHRPPKWRPYLLAYPQFKEFFIFSLRPLIGLGFFLKVGRGPAQQQAGSLPAAFFLAGDPPKRPKKLEYSANEFCDFTGIIWKVKTKQLDGAGMQVLFTECSE